MIKYSKITLVLVVMAALVICSSLACHSDAASDFEQCKTDLETGGELTKAIAALQSLLSQDSAAVQRKEIRAWLMAAHIGNRQTDLGMAELNQLLTEFPDYASTLHFILAMQYRRQAEFDKTVSAQAALDKAISELNTALALNKEPKESATPKSIRRFLMVCYASKGDLPNAIAQLRIIMNDYPDEVSTFIVGESRRWQSKLPNAIAELKKTAEALPKDDPKSKGLRGEFIKCAVSTSDWQTAAIWFEEFTADYHDYSEETGYDLVYGLQASGQIDKAVEVIDAMIKVALAKGQGTDGLLMGKADICFRGKKYREAAEAYTDAMKRESASPDYRANAIYQLALCYQKSGLINSARRYMRRVSEKYPNTEVAKKARGMLYVWDNYGMSK